MVKRKLCVSVSLSQVCSCLCVFLSVARLAAPVCVCVCAKCHFLFVNVQYVCLWWKLFSPVMALLRLCDLLTCVITLEAIASSSKLPPVCLSVCSFWDATVSFCLSFILPLSLSPPPKKPLSFLSSFLFLRSHVWMTPSPSPSLLPPRPSKWIVLEPFFSIFMLL